MARITLRQVAQKAGVSIQTASDIVNRGGERYSEKTRMRVHAAAESMGYEPNRHARLLRGGRSGQIGLVHVGDFVQAAAERNYQMHQEICAADYEVLSFHVFGDEQTVDHALRSMIESRVEGVIFANMGVPRQSDLLKLQDEGIPVVVAGVQNLVPVDTVLADHRQGAFLLVQHLVNQGYRDLAMVNSLSSTLGSTSHERTSGFVESVKALLGPNAEPRVIAPERKGIDKELDPDWICKSYYEPGAAGMRALIDTGRLPEALVCGNDYHAVAALHVCARAGIKVPHDMALVGFDATGFGSYANPALTTVAQPNVAIAKYAVERLIAAIEGHPPIPACTKLPYRLIVRESCGVGLRGMQKGASCLERPVALANR